jgi:hypothetical protein
MEHTALVCPLRDNVPPITRVSNNVYTVSMPFWRLPNYSTSLSIPNSNCIITRSLDNVAAIRGAIGAFNNPSVSNSIAMVVLAMTIIFLFASYGFSKPCAKDG